MKKFTLLLMFGLLAINASAFAGNRAIKITLSTTDAVLDTSILQAVQQALGNAMTTGHIPTMVTYNHGFGVQNRWVSCIETATIDKNHFNRFVNKLRVLITPSDTITYNITPVSSCATDNQLVCADNFTGCLNKNVFNSMASAGGYLDTIAQFQSALADITPGKVAISLKLNEDMNWVASSPADIGMPNITKNCSDMAVYGDWSSMAVSCTIKGNPAINGKRVQWQYILDMTTGFGTWQCATDADPRYAR